MLNKLSKATGYLTYQHCFYIGIVAFSALPHDSWFKKLYLSSNILWWWWYQWFGQETNTTWCKL